MGAGKHFLGRVVLIAEFQDYEQDPPYDSSRIPFVLINVHLADARNQASRPIKCADKSCRHEPRTSKINGISYIQILFVISVSESKQETEQKVKEALLQTKVSLLLTALSLPFGLMGWILRHSSSFAVEIFALAVVAFVICLPLTVIWYRTWKNRMKDAEAGRSSLRRFL